jgi:nucleoside-diphosphate-sugar epimerase
MIVAMAARLAEHLKVRLVKSATVQMRAEPSLSAHAAAVPSDPTTAQLLLSAFAEGGATMENEVDVVEPGTIVAVTGASGFIGGRLVERLVERGAAVTCLLRGDPSARLQRVGAKLCKIDIANEDAVRSSLKGIDWVFHCAYDSDNTEWNFKALRALIASCRENNWRRFVHVSSFVVYDLPAEGELTEETIATTDRSGYAYIKKELETELLDAVRRERLPATIVQPTIVYGPSCRPWTIDPADKLMNGIVVLPDQGKGICNAVYVDDVVDAMILAARNPAAVGRRFLISGEPVTWAQFYEALAKAADAPPPKYIPSETIIHENRRVRKILRLTTTPWLLARRITQRQVIKNVLQSMLNVAPATTRAYVQAQLFGPITRRPGHTHLPDRGHLEFLLARSVIRSTKARREIGYVPRYELSAGMAPTAQYLQDRKL